MGLVSGRRRPMTDAEWLRRTDPDAWQQERNRNVQEQILMELQTLVDTVKEQKVPESNVVQGGGANAQRTNTSNPRGSVLTDVARRINTD